MPHSNRAKTQYLRGLNSWLGDRSISLHFANLTDMARPAIPLLTLPNFRAVFPSDMIATQAKNAVAFEKNPVVPSKHMRPSQFSAVGWTSISDGRLKQPSAICLTREFFHWEPRFYDEGISPYNSPIDTTSTVISSIVR